LFLPDDRKPWPNRFSLDWWFLDGWRRSHEPWTVSFLSYVHYCLCLLKIIVFSLVLIPDQGYMQAFTTVLLRFQFIFAGEWMCWYPCEWNRIHKPNKPNNLTIDHR
jgi:hypothetical protein